MKHPGQISVGTSLTSGSNFGRRQREQELAAKVLAALPAIPPSDLGLDAFLRLALKGYDRSVEQLPRYLALVHGEQVVQDELARLLEQSLSEREQAAAKTMAWWLRGRSQ